METKEEKLKVKVLEVAPVTKVEKEKLKPQAFTILKLKSKKVNHKFKAYIMSKLNDEPEDKKEESKAGAIFKEKPVKTEAITIQKFLRKKQRMRN